MYNEMDFQRKHHSWALADAGAFDLEIHSTPGMHEWHHLDALVRAMIFLLSLMLCRVLERFVALTELYVDDWIVWKEKGRREMID